MSTASPSPVAVPQSDPRAELRAATLGASSKIGRSEIVEWNGQRFEVRQLTISKQKQLQANAVKKDGTADEFKTLLLGLIWSTYVPGTNILVFDNKDEAELANLPLDGFMKELSAAMGRVNKMSSLDVAVEEAEKNSNGTPSEGSSS